MPAHQGQPIAGGGSLRLQPWADPGCIARDGAIAFVGAAVGAPFDHATFVADATGVRAVARGAGGPGGAGVTSVGGDPAPGGGTLAGMFGGTPFVPSITDDGDVLFLADVHAGPVPRALFLHVAVTGSLVRIAAVGAGFSAVGPGVARSAREVLFAARATGRSAAELFRWRDGAVTPLAAVGDPAPGGGTIAALVTEWLTFADGTSVPIGPLPAVDSCGRVAFRALASGASAPGGILVRDDGGDAWWLRLGASTPVGGTYTAFGAPVLGGDGVLAVFADHTSPGGPTAGWFVGRPGAFRRALGFHDPVDDGRCLGLALSRSPMTPLDDRGDLVLWCDLSLTGGADRIVRCRADGGIDVLMRRGDALAGGAVGALNGWPSARAAAGAAVAAQLQGGALPAAHLRVSRCRPAVVVPACSVPGADLALAVPGPAGEGFVLAASTAGVAQPLPPFGVLGLGAPMLALAPGVPYSAPPATWSSRWVIPPDPGLRGVSLHFQALHVPSAGLPTLTARSTCRLR
ncbi:MAG: hypothetical protein AB7O97_03910 [Planctomycetota bacterium]